MPSPFPGMDPYLEAPALWPDFHQGMITYIREDLSPRISPRYLARIEERLVLFPIDQSIRPDVAVLERPTEASRVATNTAFAVEDVASLTLDEEPVREAYIEIVDLQHGREVVTVIEMLSPTNKNPGQGRKHYLEKQEAVLASRTSLVEIDLLRAGEHTVAAPHWMVSRFGPFDYVCCTRRGSEPNRFYLCRRTVRDPLVPIRVPLAEGEDDVALDLPAVFARCYEAANYGGDVYYTKPPLTPLSEDDASWADELLREKGMR